MNKPKKNSKKYNAEILKALSEKFGFSEDYIRKCLRGARVGIMPDKVKVEYAAGVKALRTTVEKVKNQ